MTKAELDALFSKIYGDGLSDDDLERIADLVRNSTDRAQQWRGLHILGWARAYAYAPLIASFLTRTDELSLPAIAIKALVRWFRDAKPYNDTLKSFLKGIPEDYDLDLQFDALHVAGDAFRQTHDPEILRAIVGFLTGSDELLCEAAQASLVTALAPEWENLTPKQRSDLRHAFDQVDYLGQARERLASS